MATPDPLTVYGVRITATLIGPAEYEAPVDSYGRTYVPECQVTPKTITCDVPPSTRRASAPGILVHSAGDGARLDLAPRDRHQ